MTEIADIVGDSFRLSVQASKAKQSTLLMCGVRFMAETIKILSPHKRVFLVNPDAGCPMTEQLETPMLIQMKERLPGHTVVAYINTTAEQKTHCDVCVTSSSAVRVVGNIKNNNILFIPDQHLGQYIAKRLPEKNVHFMPGGCPTHAMISVKEARRVRVAHPDALMLVHPECIAEVADMADFVGSTSQIMAYAAHHQHKTFIIGTEISITEHLQMMHPKKRFIPLSKNLICPNMKITTLMDVLACIQGQGGEEILIEKQTCDKARQCIDEMLRLNAM